MSDGSLTGACLCGHISYRLSGAISRINHCHCDQCKRHTGAAFATWVTLPADQVRWEGAAVAYFQSSDFAERGFCARCGSTLVWRRLNGDLIDVSVGTLDDPGSVRPEDHYWGKDELPWLHMVDGLPRYDAVPPRKP